MTSKPVAQLLVDLGVARSHFRSHCSYDNLPSGRPRVLRDVSRLLRPRAPVLRVRAAHLGSVHHGTATEVRAQWAAALQAPYAASAVRCRHRHPTPPAPPAAAWINQPGGEALIRND